jgi:hypothetical protein
VCVCYTYFYDIYLQYWQWGKGKRRDPTAHRVIVRLGEGNDGYGKGVEMVYFERKFIWRLNVLLFGIRLFCIGRK